VQASENTVLAEKIPELARLIPDSLNLIPDPLQKQSKNKARASPAAQTLLPVDPVPGWMPVVQWTAWLAWRRKLKGGYSDYAQKLAINTLTKLREQGEDPAEVLDQSLGKQWTGLFPIKNQGKQNATNQSHEGLANRTARILADLARTD